MPRAAARELLQWNNDGIAREDAPFDMMQK